MKCAKRVRKRKAFKKVASPLLNEVALNYMLMSNDARDKGKIEFLIVLHESMPLIPRAIRLFLLFLFKSFCYIFIAFPLLSMNMCPYLAAI